MAELRVQDFSGGETDRFRDGKPTQAQKMHNLLVSENKRLVSRDGYAGLYNDAQPLGDTTIRFLWTHETTRKAGNIFSTDGMTHETFFLANGVFMASNNVDNVWRAVESFGGTSGVGSHPQDFQGDYTRISENEFVITQDGTYPLKFFKPTDGQSEWQYVTIGLPKLGVPLQVTQNIGGTNSWVYAVVLKHDYEQRELGSTTTIDRIVRGAPGFSAVIAGVDAVNVGVPIFGTAPTDDGDGEEVVNNGATFGTLQWEVYRTLNNGTVFYKVTERASTGGVYVDNMTDATLSSKELLYTTGGAVPNDMISERPKFSTFANDTLWLASQSRFWQSKIGIPDASPGSFNAQARGGEIVALNSIDVYPIIMTTTGAFRVEGLVDDLGNGSHRVRTIDETHGALSNKTTIRAGNKIFYLSEDGIYMTNGFTTKKVSEHYNDSYKEILSRFNVAKLATASWDIVNQRVTWYFITESGDTYNNQTLTLDLKYKNDEGYCITSGELPLYDVTSATAANGQLHIATNNGFILGSDPSYASDLDLITLTNTAILWDYISCSMSFGSALMRKWFTKILFHATNKSDLTAIILTDTDESDDFRAHNPIHERGFTRGLYFLKRWFPKGRLRGTYKTIRITNSIPQILFKSDDSVLADRSGTTITTADNSSWPADVETGLFIAFGPTFTTLHEIVTFGGGDTLILASSAGTGSNSRWQITGVPTEEALELNGYTVVYTPTGEGHTQSQVEGAPNV